MLTKREYLFSVLAALDDFNERAKRKWPPKGARHIAVGGEPTDTISRQDKQPRSGAVNEEIHR